MTLTRSISKLGVVVFGVLKFSEFLIASRIPTELFADAQRFHHVRSKTMKDKVMIFTAVYRPRPDLGPEFDGKLMIAVAHELKVSLL